MSAAVRAERRMDFLFRDIKAIKNNCSKNMMVRNAKDKKSRSSTADVPSVDDDNSSMIISLDSRIKQNLACPRPRNRTIHTVRKRRPSNSLLGSDLSSFSPKNNKR